MVSREQERVNFLVISFVQKIVAEELKNVASIEKVDFLSNESVVGRLFYRVFKSQEKNVDTVCSILAHLMNKFISKLQEGSEFDAAKDAARAGAAAGKKAKQQSESDEHSAGATKMYSEFLEKLVGSILGNEVLTAANMNFQLKQVWKDQAEAGGGKIQSLRFSAEIAILIEIIQDALNELRGRKKKAGKVDNHDEEVAKKILGLIFFRMIKKMSADTDKLMLYLYPYLRETKKQILIDEGMQKQGGTFLELCAVVNHFFAGNDYQRDKQETHWADLRQ